MINIQNDVSLKPYNTFGIDVKALNYIELHSIEEIHEFLEIEELKQLEILILGGGSNTLFTKDFEGIVVRPMFTGKEVIEQDEEKIILKVGAGENWDKFVEYCVAHDYYGIENLSYIPGNVGAAPIQNIGAYGVEVKETVFQVDAIRIKDGEKKSFTNEECQFDYRSSIFKTKYKNEFIITHVTFELRKKPNFNLSYKGVGDKLKDAPVQTLESMRQAIIDIRKEKLLDPKVLGNAGSIFKNPVLPKKQIQKLLAKYPEMPTYPVSEKEEKVPAAWFVDQCGWKGERYRDAGVYEKQAIILVNLGNATGSDLLKLINDIQVSVKEKFGIELEMEVNVV